MIVKFRKNLYEKKDTVDTRENIINNLISFLQVIAMQVGHSMSNGPKFQSLGHDPSQILIKLFQIKGIYEIRLS